MVFLRKHLPMCACTIDSARCGTVQCTVRHSVVQEKGIAAAVISITTSREHRNSGYHEWIIDGDLSHSLSSPLFLPVSSSMLFRPKHYNIQYIKCKYNVKNRTRSSQRQAKWHKKWMKCRMDVARTTKRRFNFYDFLREENRELYFMSNGGMANRKRTSEIVPAFRYGIYEFFLVNESKNEGCWLSTYVPWIFRSFELRIVFNIFQIATNSGIRPELIFFAFVFELEMNQCFVFKLRSKSFFLLLITAKSNDSSPARSLSALFSKTCFSIKMHIFVGQFEFVRHEYIK